MPGDPSPQLRREIGHVLFLDIVGYSKLLIGEQSQQLQTLKGIVRGTEQFRVAEAEGKLLRLPTGDGGALVFRTSAEAPVLCAQEISRALKACPELRVRMGIHSGPVNEVSDLNEQANMAGAGINFAQRVMDCGDAGHVLLSKHVADDIDDYPEWRPYLHDLGECEVKHGVRAHLFNLYGDDFGNSAVPAKVQSAARLARKSSRAPWLIAAMVMALAAIAAAAFWQRAQRASAPQSSSAAPEKSIAVLPFENLSSDKENAYFTDGVQDEILTRLARIADLKVISRTSVMQYKTGVARNLRKIGEELGVARVLEGSVQRAANKVRVNAQLIDARTDAHLWAQTYDRELADVFAIQSEIAQAIADQLQAKLSPAEKNAIEERPTADIAAFDLYSRGKTLLLTSGAGAGIETRLREGIKLLESAVARDPTFHSAFCELVWGNDRLYAEGYDHTPERRAAAEAALRSAEQLKPDSPETHLARANHLYFVLRDYEGAQAQLDIAAGGLPNDSRVPELKGYIVRRKGKAEEGLLLLKQAATLDPRNDFLLEQIAASQLQLRQNAEAAESCDRALQIKPDDLLFRLYRSEVEWYWHADPGPQCRLVEEVRSKTPAAVSDVADNWFECALAKHDWAAAEQALAALGDNPCWADNGIQFSRQFGEGLLARAMHNDARARRAFTAARVEQEQLVQKQKDYGPPLCVLGLIDAALGNKEAALQEGRRAMELLPREKDASNNEMLVGYFAVIAAWAGEKDLALQQLNEAIPLPGAAYITSYGFLKLMPFWDPLRGDPRFEKIVASLAPK